jgi:transcription initiation factor IIE alpha subunit
MRRLLSGLYFCPQCDDDFDLDLTPESEARCPTCRVVLEEDQGAEEDDQEGE